MIRRCEAVEDGDDKVAKDRRYPVQRVSPWLFLVILVVTVVVILAGVFRFEPLSRVVNWLAVVL